MTAIIATAKPSAVEISASEIPAATTEKPPVPITAIDWNATRMPTTVPNSPMNGAEAPEVASKIRLSPPLLGSAGVLGFPYVTNCSVVWNFAQNQEGAKQFLADLIENSKTAYEKSAGCNFPLYQKTLPNLIKLLEDDPRADPPYKYKELKDALYWTRNLGFPGYANPIGMEVFNSFVIPRMFTSVITGQSSPEDAVHVAEAEVMRIADRWKQA